MGKESFPTRGKGTVLDSRLLLGAWRPLQGRVRPQLGHSKNRKGNQLYMQSDFQKGEMKGVVLTSLS